MTDPSSPADMKKIQVVFSGLFAAAEVKKRSSTLALKRQGAEGMPD